MVMTLSIHNNIRRENTHILRRAHHAPPVRVVDHARRAYRVEVVDADVLAFFDA